MGGLPESSAPTAAPRMTTAGGKYIIIIPHKEMDVLHTDVT